MNIVYPHEDIVIAKICGCKVNKVTYSFSEGFHSLFVDKKAVIRAEIKASKKLLKYTTNESEKSVISIEVSNLNTALDLMPWGE